MKNKIVYLVFLFSFFMSNNLIAQNIYVDLELVLAVDVSNEKGTFFRHPDVIAAISN